MNLDNYVTFVSLRPKNAAFSLGPYRDDIGNYFALHGSTNDKGEDVPYKVKFKHSKRHVRFHKDKADKDGNNFVEWLRNHPRCVGNPYGTPDNLCWFKEANSEKDAKVAFEDYELRNKAESYAISLKGKELTRVASVLGFVGNPSVVHTNILHYASKSPADFLDKIKDPNLDHEATMRDALEAKVINKRGFRYVFNEVHLGNDEEAVIKKIAEDKDLKATLEKAVAVATGKKQ